MFYHSFSFLERKTISLLTRKKETPEQAHGHVKMLVEIILIIWFNLF